MNEGMKLYYDYTISPLGELYYQTVFTQLKDIASKKILDFGSGFGFISNFLAKKNDVIALEIDASMLEEAKKEERYTQIHSDLSYVKTIKSESFDFITCHLVFEFVENPQEILNELLRVLKKEGTLSIIRHNRAGRVIQALVQENNFEETTKLLEGNPSYSSAFGNINYYENETLLNWAENKVKIEQIFGIRALASLHSAEMQAQENWLEKVFPIELALLAEKRYIDIAYFNHLMIKKI